MAWLAAAARLVKAAPDPVSGHVHTAVSVAGGHPGRIRQTRLRVWPMARPAPGTRPRASLLVFSWDI